MFSSLLAVFGAIAALPSIQAVALPQSPNADPSVGKTCSSWGFMSLGQLEVYNYRNYEMYVAADYTPELNAGKMRLNWPRNPLTNDHVRIKPGGFYEFDRDTNMELIQRDRDFYLFICKVAEYNPDNSYCELIPGTFRIPSPGNKQWVARVDIGRPNPSCVVDRPMRKAWAP